MNRRGFFSFIGGAAAAAVLPVPEEFIIDGPIVADPLTAHTVIPGGIIQSGTLRATHIVVGSTTLSEFVSA